MKVSGMYLQGNEWEFISEQEYKLHKYPYSGTPARVRDGKDNNPWRDDYSALKYEETNDGRYLISLQGINCFRIQKELEVKYKFRMVEAELIDTYVEDENIFSQNDKLTLLEKYRKYTKIKKINLDLEEIEKIELSQIIKFIAMVSPFKDIEKQALLETTSFEDLYNKINSIIELEIMGQNSNFTIN